MTILHNALLRWILLGLPILGFADLHAAEMTNNNNNTPTGAIGLIVASGIIGYIICALSVVALAVCLDAFFATRRKKMLPLTTLGRIEAMLNDDNLDGALMVCREDDSVMARIAAAGLSHCGMGYERMAAAVAAETTAQEAMLYQKINLINLFAGIAPSLGLLGTVVGMIEAFSAMAVRGGNADIAALSGGIYVALVTTLEGVAVSIPCAAFYTILRGRVAQAMAALGVINDEILERFRDEIVMEETPRLE